MGDRIRKWTAALLAGMILAMIQLVPVSGAVFVCEHGNIKKPEPTFAKKDMDLHTLNMDSGLWLSNDFGVIERNEGQVGKEGLLQQELHARAWVLMDADSGRILAGKDVDTAYPMASTTKILTCILALEQGESDDWVKVSEKAASMPDVQLNMRAGERYRLLDLLYSLMLESHNDSAVAVAEHIGGSVEEFAKKMNQKAREIGCQNVCFVTPNGLDGEDADGKEHSASAADMARIMRYCTFQSPCREAFLEITRTASRTIQDASGSRSFYLANHNALLSQCPEALSGKTGFTGKAGYCYVAALKKEGKAFTAALLGCGWPPHKTYKWVDMRKLNQYAFEVYNWYDIFDRAKTFPEITVQRGVKETTSLTFNLPPEKQTLPALLRADEEPDIRYEYPTELEAPVRKGEEVGQASYYISGKQVAAYPIYAAETVEKIDYGWCLKRCVSYFETGLGLMWQKAGN